MSKKGSFLIGTVNGTVGRSLLSFNLLKRGSVYYCRLWVPLELRALLRRRELKKSLKTDDRKAARTQARLLSARAEEFYMQARSGVFTERERERLAAELIAEFTGRITELKKDRGDALDWLFCERAGSVSANIEVIDASLKTPRTPADVQIAVAWYESRIDSLEQEVATELFSHETRQLAKWAAEKNNYNMELPPHEWFMEPGRKYPSLAKRDHEIEPDTEEHIILTEENLVWYEPAPLKFHDLCLTVVNAQIDTYRHELLRMQGKKDTPLQREIAARIEAAKPKKRLSELWASFQQDRMSIKKWGSATLKKYNGFYRVFEDIAGDCELALFEDDGAAARFIENIQKYPKGKNQITSPYRGKAFNPAWADKDGFAGLEPLQINDMLIQLSAWFDYALENPKPWGISFNPFKNKRLPVSNDDRKPKSAYTMEELESMIIGLMEQRPHVQPERFWIPLLGLFTGARSNELCQLRVNDVELKDGIPVINFCHLPDLMQFTKAKKSRCCPVHPTLVKLGFTDFVHKQKTLGHERLFPNLKLFEEKWNKRFGQWYNENFEPAFISDEKDKSFHSTRHSFISWFKANLEMSLHNLSVVKSMVGHLDNIDKSLMGIDLEKDMTWGSKNYGDKHSPKVQLALLKKLDYEVDFSVLKKRLI